LPPSTLPPLPNADASLAARLAQTIADGRDGHALVLPLAPISAAAPRAKVQRLAIRLLAGLTGSRGAFIAPLPPDELLLVCPGVPADEIETRLAWIDQVLGLNAGDAPAGVSKALAAWYPLRDGGAVDALMTFVRQRDDSAVRSGSEPALAEVPVRPLTPDVLTGLCEGLETAEVTPFIRRQRALAFGGGAAPRPFLCETYVSIPALADALAPGVDLLSNGALFQFLTGVLDEKLMRDLPNSAPPAPEPISLNLNIASIASPAFEAFERSWSRWAPPIIELQAADVLAHGENYVHARDALKERGFRVLIDAVQPKALLAIDVAGFAADWLKLFWNDGVARGWSATERSTFARRIAEIGRERLILARVDGEDALSWGLRFGITRFQGRFIDRLIAAMTLKGQM
jgi:hypothetical protein